MATTSLISNINSASRPESVSVLASNMDYLAVISVEGDDSLLTGGRGAMFPMRANLPERFHMEMGAQWGMPLAQANAGDMAGSLLGSGAQSLVEIGAGAAGVGTKLKSQFFQVWEQSTPLTLNLDLVFYAQDNTEREIRQRHVALLKLCAPSSDGQVLKAPGPRLIGDNSEGRRITIQIGRYLTVTDAIITNVGSDVVTLLDENGIPIAMTINLAFSTWNACVTGEDLDKMFYGGG